MKTIVIVFLSLGLLYAGECRAALGLNDLSILLPLPERADDSAQLSPVSSGAQGALLSLKTFQGIIQLVPEHPNFKIWRDQLKVVAVRMDPCFVEGEGPLPCRRQIRLVWQPVIEGTDGVTTRDAAIHSFYEFDEATFAVLWKDWQRLSSGKSTDALQVHPRLKSEGLQGPYWKYLRALLLKHCGEKNLIRMTAMNVMADEMLWIFSGFDVVDGAPKVMNIPRVRGQTHAVTQTSFQFQSFTGGMTPRPEVARGSDQAFAELTSDSYRFKKSYSETQVKEMLSTVFEYENPEKHNPGTLDCASCHLANMVHQWGEANYKHFDWKNEFKAVAFKSSWNLANTSRNIVRPNQLRAFGYFGREPAISQRVINETAATANSLIR